MKWLLMIGCLVVVVMLLLVQPASTGHVIMNEDEILGRCTSTCRNMPTLYGKHGCRKLSGCRRSSEGWTRGFVRCDYCKCYCEKPHEAEKDVVVDRRKMSINEKDLYGTCKGTCTSSRGLVRTNFKKCQEVRDCIKERNGYYSWFVRCDHCTCTCVNTKYAASYVIINPKYDMSQAATDKGAPVALTETRIDNHGDNPQTVTRRLVYNFVKTTSVSTSHSMETGLSVTVTAGFKVKGVGDFSTSVETSFKYGYTYTAGDSKSESVADWLSASVVVPGKSSKVVEIVGHRMKIDVPYTATLQINYKDGTVKTKGIKGVYSNVDFANFRVKYHRSKKL